MSKEQRRILEEHVRKVLLEDLKQKKASNATVRRVAEKIYKAVPLNKIKEAA